MPTAKGSGAIMADWLALHDLTPEHCLRALDARPASTVAANTVTDLPPELSPLVVWNASADAMLGRMPSLRDVIIKVRSETITEFAPNTTKYPRPFTLHDRGDGKCHVSCPWTGRAQDALNVAHEFGHALQIGASNDRFVPPVLREVAAMISERSVVRLFGSAGLR